MHHDLDDLFHVMDAKFEPMQMGWSVGRPMGMVRSGRRRSPRTETFLADKKWRYSVKIGDFDPQHVKVENGEPELSTKILFSATFRPLIYEPFCRQKIN